MIMYIKIITSIPNTRAVFLNKLSLLGDAMHEGYCANH